MNVASETTNSVHLDGVIELPVFLQTPALNLRERRINKIAHLIWREDLIANGNDCSIDAGCGGRIRTDVQVRRAEIAARS